MEPVNGYSETAESRFWAKVDQDGDGGCWVWLAALTEHGYGRLGRGGKRGGVVLAHRFAYELLVGSIPEGMSIDHRCHNPACVNPEHLRPVTHKQNHENRAGSQRNNRSSGVRGVTWNRRRNAWQAQVKQRGKNYYIGLFATVDEARLAAAAKRNELFTHNDLDRVAP